MSIYSKKRIHLFTFIVMCGGMIFSNGTRETENVGTIEKVVIDHDIMVDFAEVQWTDINSTTAVARVVLEALGYETSSKMISVPIAFQSLSTGDLDIFLGDWEPSMSQITGPLLEKGEIIDLTTNLSGAKYTLAAPSYVADSGIQDFSDIAKYGEQLDYKIYGIEPGNDGNILIQDMIDSDAFGLGEFELIESSEAGMLAQVRSEVKDQRWIVFLGWAPHPMNTVFDIEYLTGGDDYFGPDFGAATVHTITRVGYAEENPNLGRFFRNLKFSLDMEGEIMNDIANGMTAREAAEKWLKNNPSVLKKWLEGVIAVNGKNGLQTAQKSLDL